MKFITLTDKGRAYLKERNAIMTDIAQDITNDLNSEDIENVRQVLEKKALIIALKHITIINRFLKVFKYKTKYVMIEHLLFSYN